MQFSAGFLSSHKNEQQSFFILIYCILVHTECVMRYPVLPDKWVDMVDDSASITSRMLTIRMMMQINANQMIHKYSERMVFNPGLEIG